MTRGAGGCARVVLAVLSALGGAAILLEPSDAAPLPCSSGLVELTFDSGPEPVDTPRVLDILREHQVKATFFMLGPRVEARPDLVQRVAEEGHVVANHSWTHRRLTQLTDEEVDREIGDTAEALESTGAEVSALMRPPNGDTDPRVDAIIANHGLKRVTWTISGKDWTDWTADQIANNIIERLRVQRRNNVLLHDWGYAHSANAIPAIVRDARARGYCFTTMDPVTGAAVVPVPRATVKTYRGYERGSFPVRAVVSLDQPTSRTTSVLVRTYAVTARSPLDYRSVERRVWFPAGVQRQLVKIPVVDDRVPEKTEQLSVGLADPRGLTRSPAARADIVSNE